MAPSPTGPLHFGTARVALFNYLFARKSGGTFILRIDDTDRERSTKESETQIIEGLHWLGIHWDEGPDAGGDFGPYRQSERLPVYRKYLEHLMASGHAYYCYCTKEELEAEKQSLLAEGLPPRYSGKCCKMPHPEQGRPAQVIRFKVPAKIVEFTDIVRGKISYDAALFGDIAIAKDLSTPLYNFASVVDDHEMRISHVIRGEDHISNTPKQILLLEALGFRAPVYAHLPLILNADRSKLSKRTADTSLMDYKEKGYLPSALLNFMAFLGWHPKGEEEVFDLESLVREFDIERIQKAGAVFSNDKLDWMNKEHIRRMSASEFSSAIQPFLEAQGIHPDPELLSKVFLQEKERLTTLADFIPMTRFFFGLPDYDANLLVWKNSSPQKVAEIFPHIAKVIKGLDESSYSKEAILQSLGSLIEKEGRGAVLWPLRVSLSGQAASADPTDIMAVLGKNEVDARIDIALEKLS